MAAKSIFVMLPLQEEYEDVYQIIVNSVRGVSSELSIPLECKRADELGPGRITDQILVAIRSSDIVIAELTGGNPNVMYELGYSHALDKPAIILNQDVHASPFDVKDIRQIVYDRNRLVKDCQPRIISFLKAILESLIDKSSGDDASPADGISTAAQESDTYITDQDIRPRRASLSVVADLQAIHIQLERANGRGLREDIVNAAVRLRELLDRLVLPPGTNDQLVRQISSFAGNCAVELEEASMFVEAEDVYRRCIGLFPKQSGIHLQFADFLIDAGRFDEARSELDRVRELDPESDRLAREEVKLGLASRGMGEEAGKQLAAAFASDPARHGMAYLYYLSQTAAGLPSYEAAWQRWNDALPENQRTTSKRVLADYLASSSDPVIEQRGLDLYEEMLPGLQGEGRHAVLHNMASLYVTRDEERARALWMECYRMRPGDEHVRIAFSQFLSNRGETDLALRVASGEDI